MLQYSFLSDSTQPTENTCIEPHLNCCVMYSVAAHRTGNPHYVGTNNSAMNEGKLVLVHLEHNSITGVSKLGCTH